MPLSPPDHLIRAVDPALRRIGMKWRAERDRLAKMKIPMIMVLSDTWGYGTEKTPVVGHSLIKPFRMHHLYPRDITVHNLVTTVGNTCILAVPVLLFCLYLLWAIEHGFLAFAILCTTLMAAATVATNLFHKWAHQESPSKGVRILQRMRLVLDPDHHELHHTRPFDKHYCITNGWLNPVLNKIGFFRKLEAMLRLIGVKATNTADREPAK